METDKHYFIEGLFIIGIAVATALAFMWLSKSGHRDDVLYQRYRLLHLSVCLICACEILL